MSKRFWRNDTRWAALFLAPAVLGIGLFTALPALGSFLISLSDWDLLALPSFVGLKNYADLSADPLFWQVFGQTLVFATLYLVADLVLALGLAVALNQRLRGLGLFRTAYFLPVACSMVAVALLWSWIYDPRYGALNQLLGVVGINPVAWLSDPRTAMPAVVAVTVWKHLGYDTMLLLAGLQAIPSQYLEAAKVDGAGSAQGFWRVTFPLLAPMVLLVGIMATIRAFQTFDAVYLMTAGGPYKSTQVAMYWLYQNAFVYFKLGKASALAYVLFAVLVALSGIQWAMRKRWVHSEA